MNKEVFLKIYGRVHGVFFRINAQEKAEKLNLKGWVKNAEDGTLEITAQGEENNLKQFIDWCHNGPRLAEVNKVKVKWHKITDQFDNFEIR